MKLLRLLIIFFTLTGGLSAKVFWLGPAFTLGHGIYSGVGGDTTTLTGLGVGISAAYTAPDYKPMWFKFSLVKETQMIVNRSGQDDSSICQSGFLNNFYKLPGECGALLWRADVMYDLKWATIGGGLALHAHGGFTFQKNRIVNSHFKQTTLSVLLAKKIMQPNGTMLLPALRIERSIFFSQPVDNPESPVAWLFYLEFSSKWSIL